ncbi:MAG: hypothetical protein E3J72_12805 [Planctomycetota bacterium]|nr:MAG: hypothetical protein E3J72_12805 [Planctomycetota bacterium]
MTKVSNKLIWGLPAGIVVCIVLIFGSIYGYDYYRLRMAKADLFSLDEKRMGRGFACLLERERKGMKVIEDFCRENSEADWGPEIDGLKLRVSIKGNMFASQSPDKKVLLDFELKNVSDKEIQVGRPVDAGRNLRYEWEFRITPNGKIDKTEHDFEKGGRKYDRCKVKSGEKITAKISHHFLPGLYFKASFWGVFGGIHHARPISNTITFVVLP